MNKNDHATGQLYVISAPSGAGKTSLVKALLESTPNLEVSVSHTTRDIRPGETDGINYHFVNESEFTSIRDANGFFEWAQVFGNFYGTSSQAVQEKLADDIDVIVEIDWQGARQVKQQLPDAIGIFILPPSVEVLQSRLDSRGQDSAEVIASRMQQAKDEMSHYDEFDYVLVNDDFDTTLSALESVVFAQRERLDNQKQRNNTLIAALLA